MNITLLLVTILYFCVAALFMYFYWKNSYDFFATIGAIKKEFKSRCVFCINKEAIAKKVGVEKSIELEELLEDTLDLNHGISCKEPVRGLNLNLCLKDPLSEDEIKIREKVLKILNRKKQVIYSENKEKLIVPMEAILFLTKKYNPLVSEEGDIILSVKKEQPTASELVKELTGIFESEGLIHKEDKELSESVEKFKKMLDKRSESPENLSSKQDEKEEEVDQVMKKEEAESHNFDDLKITNEKDEKEGNYQPEEEFNPNTASENSKSQDFGLTDTLLSPYDEEGEIEFEDEDDEDMGMSMDEVLEGAISEIDDLEDFAKDKENEVDFYKKIEYKSKKGAFLDFKNIEYSMKHLFSDSESLSCFFNNLAKTSPLVFNPSKTVVLADLNNIYFAIAKMCGIEFLNCVDSFSRLKKDNRDVVRAIDEIFELFLSDMISESKRVSSYLVKEKGSKNSFISKGALFKVDSFLNGLSYEDLDYFRSTPHESRYTVVKKASKEDFRGSTPLLADIKDVEII